MSSVVLGAATRASLNSGGASTTFSFTVPAGAQALYVRAGYWINSGGTQLTSVTWNGTGLTRVAAGPNPASGDRSDVWRLLSPASGTFNIVVTATNAFGDAYAQCATSGLDTGTPEGTPVGASGSSTAPATASSINAAAADLIIDAGGGDSTGTPTFTQNGSQTLDASNNNSGEQSFYSHKDGNGSGTQNMAWTISASRSWSLVAIPLKAAVGGGGFTATSRRRMGMSRVGSRTMMRAA